MTELFRYRIDETRKMVLCDDRYWYCHDSGEEPKVWNLASDDNMAMAAEIQRLRAELDGARQEAFRHDFVVDCDDDPEELRQADDLRTIVGWIAEAESTARKERDEAYAEIERLRSNPRTAFLCAKCVGGIYERDAVCVDGDKHYHAICYVTRRAEMAEAEIYLLRAELSRARETIRLAASRHQRSDCRPVESDMI